MRIKCAAILHEGLIYEGRNHCEIGTNMLARRCCKRPFPGGPNQGFVTDLGHYVRRETAMCIALKAGQVIKGKTCHPTRLFSEDL